MKKLLPSLAIFLSTAISSTAVTLIEQPIDQRVIEMEFVNWGNIGASKNRLWVIFDFGTDQLHVGDRIDMILYEDSIDDTPLISLKFDGSQSSNGYAFGYDREENFQDGQAIISLTLYAGSITFDRIFAETIIDGERYQFDSGPFALVPEPSSISLFFLTALCACRRRVVSPKQSPNIIAEKDAGNAVQS